MSVQPNLQSYTAQGDRQGESDWVLIEGYPVATTPSPVVEHQTTSLAVARQLGECLDDCPCCQTLFETVVEFSGGTVVRPDVLVMSYPLEGDHPTPKLDLVFEVLSPKIASGTMVDILLQASKFT